MATFPLTVVINIKEGQSEKLERFLVDEIGQPEKLHSNGYLRFREFDMVHFARFVLIGGGLKATCGAKNRLYFSAVIDGSWQNFIDQMIKKAPKAVEEIFGKCQGYPILPISNQDFSILFKDFIRGHMLDVNTFFAAYKNTTVQEVKAAIELRKQLQKFLNQEQYQGLLDSLAELQMPVDRWEPLKKAAIRVLTYPISTLINAVLSNFLGSLYPKMSKAPITENDIVNPTVSARDTDWLDIVENEMTVITKIRQDKKPQLVRFLSILDFAAKNLINDGSLSGLTTIHFGRWVIIDGGENLLFESNYDGNWEQYIGDFVDNAADPLDAIWANGSVEYPTRGSRDLQAFKQSIIDHQSRAQVFYTAYPNESVKNILNDLAISRKLGQFMGQKSVTEWLRRI